MSDKKVTLKYNAEIANTFSEILTQEGNWELTVINPLLGEQTITLPNDIAMAVAIAIATATEAGREEGRKKGYEEAKKKYQAIHDAYRGKYSHIFTKPNTTIDKEYYWRHDGTDTWTVNGWTE
jgi:hypothetical protein